MAHHPDVYAQCRLKRGNVVQTRIGVRFLGSPPTLLSL